MLGGSWLGGYHREVAVGRRALHRQEKKGLVPLAGRYCWWAPSRSQSYRARLLKVERLTPAPSFQSGTPGETRSSPQRRIFYNGIGYCSLSEAALGVLLEQLVDGFKVKEGETFQVSLGNGRCVDFLIRGVLVEYHALRLFPEHGQYGDFSSRREYRDYRKRLRRVRSSARRRHQLYRATCRRLAARYYKIRRAWVDRSPTMKGTELLVAVSREEFYDRVILRFGGPELPSKGEFLALFWWWVNIIARHNGLPTLNKSCYKKVA